MAGMTWMCEHGNHGTKALRWVTESWKPMYSGHCAGTIYSVTTREQTRCACECHA
jgi:hypothetical protein